MVARRTRALADYRVKNTTYAALMRANERGCEVPPGGKVRYVVVDRSSEAVLDRVRLAEELEEVPVGVWVAPPTTVNWPSVRFGPSSLRLGGPPSNCVRTSTSPTFWRSPFRVVQSKNFSGRALLVRIEPLSWQQEDGLCVLVKRQPRSLQPGPWMKEVQHLLPPSPSPVFLRGGFEHGGERIVRVGRCHTDRVQLRDGDDGCLILMRKATKNSDVSPPGGSGFERRNGVVAVHGQQSVDHHHR